MRIDPANIRSPLLADVIEAHGGLDRWNGFEKVEAEIVGGGGLFRFKGSPPVSGRGSSPSGCTSSAPRSRPPARRTGSSCSRLTGWRSRRLTAW